MGLGGYGFHLEQNNMEYFDASFQYGILLIGAFDSDTENLKQFDDAAKKDDSLFVRKILHADKLPWCEIYARDFCYNDSGGSHKKSIDSWTLEEDWSFIHSASTRYLIHNHSRRKTGQRLAENVALILCELSEGIVTEFGSKPNKSSAMKPQFKTITAQRGKEKGK